MKRLMLSISAALWVAACASRPCEIAASDYNQSCAADSDCVPVYQTSTCGGLCACPNAAINRSAQAEYEADLQARVAPHNACFCPLIAVHCVKSTCTEGSP